MQINTLYSSGNGILDPKFYVKTDTGVFIRNFNLNIQQSGATAIQIPSNPFSIAGSGNSYLQINIQNKASGTRATADLVITANNGTDAANYINLGINNSGYNDPTFSNGSGLDGYLFINGGSLDIGTQTTGTSIEFHVGGTTLDRTIARMTSSGLNIVSGTLTASNVVYNTGTQNISGAKIFFDSGIFSLSGASTIPLPNNPLSIVGSGNTYVQLNIQNRATGKLASADLVITSNNGTDNTNYINLGINNSGYSDPEFSAGTGLDGYLYIDGGNLDIGTKTPNTAIEFHAGGATAANTIARISQSGLNIVSGNLTVNNTGVVLSGSIPFVMNFGHSQIATPTTGLTTGYFGIQGDGGVVTLTNNEKRRIPILQDCFLRKVAWTNFAKTTIPSGMLTGYFKNFGPNAFNDDKTLGVQVTTGLSIPAVNIMYNSISGDLNLPIKTGDYVSFYYVSNFSGTSTVNYAVNVGAYFYV